MKSPICLAVTLMFSVIFLPHCSSLKNQKIAKKNKETVRLWFEEGWNNNRNLELIERCFDPSWKDGNPLRGDQISGHEGMKQLVNSYNEGASNARFTITHLFADESQVVIRYEVVAIHSGDLFGIPATGKEFTSTGLVLYEMIDERIAVSWQELDLTGIINQLKN